MNAATSSSATPAFGLFIWASIWLFFMFCGLNIGRKKGRGALGLALGAFLGLIGLFIISRLSPSKAYAQAHARVTPVRALQPRVVIQEQPRAAQPPLVIPQPQPVQAPLVIPPQPLALQHSDGWWPDPLGRHEHRYHDGSKWTDHVSDNGVTSVSPATPVSTPHQ
jgi:hypothetical protein